MVLELVHGETLRDMQLREPIPQEKVLRFTAHVLEALVYAHGLGVVHRDIKPSNIMITTQGVVKLLDFGIARTEQASDLTRAGFLVGSLNYMSPEQVRGEKATAKSDIYSVGVTLYELLTGRLPIVGSSNYEIMLGHMQRLPVAPHEIAAVPRSLSAAVMRALEKDPDARFESAQAFLQALGRAGRGWNNSGDDALGDARCCCRSTARHAERVNQSDGHLRRAANSLFRQHPGDDARGHHPEARSLHRPGSQVRHQKAGRPARGYGYHLSRSRQADQFRDRSSSVSTRQSEIDQPRRRPRFWPVIHKGICLFELAAIAFSEMV